MTGPYIAVDGSLITEEMIVSWNKAYEAGEFPEGEHTIGDVVYGVPQRSDKDNKQTQQ